MKLTVQIGKHSYAVAPAGHDISIPMLFDGPQPNTYGVPAATAQAFEGGGFVGDTRRGGSCNFETYTFTPHCNGTHTECIGHIARERIAIARTLAPELVPATLITVTPRPAAESGDTYAPPLDPADLVIDRAALEIALEGIEKDFLQALVIRTLPNEADKRSRDYMAQVPAFFTLAAMQSIADRGVQHLLVDLPSVDRLFDEGRLSAHHIFWNVPQGSHEVGPQAATERTITEMIYVPDAVADGSYLLDLQIAPFVSDAAPSRPVLYALNSISGE